LSLLHETSYYGKLQAFKSKLASAVTAGDAGITQSASDYGCQQFPCRLAVIPE